jgi:hypothetical protein
MWLPGNLGDQLEVPIVVKPYGAMHLSNRGDHQIRDGPSMLAPDRKRLDRSNDLILRG